MQQYLTSIKSIERPSFKDLSGVKGQDLYPGAYKEDTTETFNAMTKVKSSSNGVVTTGLWPLDHESYYDWRHSSHKHSVWKQWIFMARVEKIIIARYRAKMFRNCPSSALIRDQLEVLLSPQCTPTIVSSRSPTDSVNTLPQSKFYWPDNIKVEHAPEPEKESSHSTTSRKGQNAPAASCVQKAVDVQEVKSEQLRQEESQGMVADITAIFKRLHSAQAGLAVPGQEGFFRPIVDKLDDLEAVSVSNPHLTIRILLTIFIVFSGIHAEYRSH